MIDAKGTGMELAKNYLGVSLVEEKEDDSDRNEEQREESDHESNHGAGRSRQQKTYDRFSLPVTSVAGIRMLEEDIQDDLL